jgi:hypothetical protein
VITVHTQALLVSVGGDKPHPYSTKSQTPNNIEIQKLKVKNQNDNSKRKTFNLCSVILHFYFCFLHFVWICLEHGFQDLESS